MKYLILTMLLFSSTLLLANSDCEESLLGKDSSPGIGPRDAMMKLVVGAGGVVDESEFVTKPGVMLLAKTVSDPGEPMHPKHLLASFLVAGVSIETSMEIFAHRGDGARLTSSMTQAMDDPLFVVEGRSQAEQRKLISQIQELRNAERTKQAPFQAWAPSVLEARNVFNRTAPASKATALVISMPLESFHWMFIGRMKKRGNEPEVQTVMRRMIQALHALYPDVIRTADEYESIAMNEGFGEQGGVFREFDEPPARSPGARAPVVKIMGSSDLTAEGSGLLSALNISGDATPEERLREFKARLTYLSFLKKPADPGRYNKQILGHGHWSVTRSWNTLIGIEATGPMIAKELSSLGLRSSSRDGNVYLSGNLQSYHEFFFDVFGRNDLHQGSYRIAREMLRLMSGRYPGIFKTLGEYSGSALKMAWSDPGLRRILEDKIVGGLLDFNPTLAKRFLRELAKSIASGDRDHFLYARLRQMLRPHLAELKAAWAKYDDGTDLRMARTIAGFLPNKADSLVDIGAGNGSITRNLGEILDVKEGQLFAVEIVPLPASQGTLAWIAPDARSGVLPLASASMDVAVLSMVLHHAREPEQVLKEAHRVLRPGGKLVIREHDASTIESKLYNRVIDELLDRCIDYAPEALPGTHYRGASQWSEFLTELGFHVDLVQRDGPPSLSNPTWIVVSKPGGKQ